MEGNFLNEKPILSEHYNELLTNLNSTDVKEIKRIINDIPNKYGLSLSDINIKLCNNRNCSLNEKVQQVSLPLDELFMKMF